MPDQPYRTGVPDRLRVFVSSTITECETEREAARRAIISLNFEPVLFEREGARAEPPRDFYLRKLHDSHVVVGIYRLSYGWIDGAKGMAISGLEDEYREAHRLGRDLLAYVLRPDAGRDPRLASMVNELKSGPNVLYFYDDGEDLQTRIRDDLTAFVTDRVTRAQGAVVDIRSAATVLGSIFREGALRIRRSGLLDALGQAASLSRVVWIVGDAGAGKTALAAEWAEGRGAAYVAARGLDPRSTILAIAHALHLADDAELGAPLFEDARALLMARWSQGRGWPLVLDDPEDLDAIWPVLTDCLTSDGAGSVVVVSRDPGASRPGGRLHVPGFSEEELDALRLIAGARVEDARVGDLPVTLRRATVSGDPVARLAILEATVREAVGYLALSPAPLDLDDLQRLIGPTAGSAVALAAALETLDDLLSDTPSGYEFVHETFRDGVVRDLDGKPQLRVLLTDRLSRCLAKTGRAWAAFELRRDDPEQAERLANRSVREAVFTGSSRRLADALDFLAERYRSRGERGPLLSVLLSLADVRTNQGRAHDVPGFLDEALAVASDLGDEDARNVVELLQASLELRRSSSKVALGRIRMLRSTAEAEDRLGDVARLYLEEGIAFLGVSEAEQAVALFRKALEMFERQGDGYGVEVATRNLVVALASFPGGLAESERLRSTFGEREASSPRYRAWLCNILVPRLRREKKFDEAEAMAREAIAIGGQLGDQYVIAINQVVLGNVLREAGRLQEALDVYAAGGRTAQAVGRFDIEGKSSRLLALTENTIADAASGGERRAHAARAEQYATHAAGLLSDSFAWGERAHSLEERGDARLLLDREDDALGDYADAVAGFLSSDDSGETERLLPFLASRLDGRTDAPTLITRAFGAGDDGREGSEAWTHALSVTLERCPRAVAPGVLGVLVRGFLPAADGVWWHHCLVRCLLAIDRRERSLARRDLGSILLMASLAYGKHRAFSVNDLIMVAGICLGRSARLTMRWRPGSDLEMIVRIGRDEQVLLTIRTEAKRPEAVFVALFVASFLDAFGNELAAILFGGDLQEGAALDVVVFAQAGETGAMADFFAKGTKERPVAIARVAPKDGEEVPIVMFARADAVVALEADPARGGELEIMLAHFVEEVLHATVGASLDDEIYSSKVRDLLISALR